MDRQSLAFDTPHCVNEYGRLRKVMLCRPEYMKIREVINETQKHYKEENIDTEAALRQHDNLVRLLRSLNVEVILLPPEPSLPEQVFTRDIGFVIGGKLFVSKMKRTIRTGEEDVLERWAERMELSRVRMEKSIEGGDVIVDDRTVWIGDSDRTSGAAAARLQEEVPDRNVSVISFDPRYLHLDCVFNPVSSSEALIYPPAIHPDDLEKIRERYHCIEVPDNEQFTLGTNVLSVGGGTIVSLPDNMQVNRELDKRGYRVILVDIGEIIKSGGSFRCITMPLLREP